MYIAMSNTRTFSSALSFKNVAVWVSWTDLTVLFAVVLQS